MANKQQELRTKIVLDADNAISKITELGNALDAVNKISFSNIKGAFDSINSAFQASADKAKKNTSDIAKSEKELQSIIEKRAKLIKEVEVAYSKNKTGDFSKEISSIATMSKEVADLNSLLGRSSKTLADLKAALAMTGGSNSPLFQGIQNQLKEYFAAKKSVDDAVNKAKTSVYGDKTPTKDVEKIKMLQEEKKLLNEVSSIRKSMKYYQGDTGLTASDTVLKKAKVDWNDILERSKQYKNVISNMQADNPFKNINVKQPVSKVDTSAAEKELKTIVEERAKMIKDVETAYSQNKQGDFSSEIDSIARMSRQVAELNALLGRSSRTLLDLKNSLAMTGGANSPLFSGVQKQMEEYFKTKKSVDDAVKVVKTSVYGSNKPTAEETAKIKALQEEKKLLNEVDSIRKAMRYYQGDTGLAISETSLKKAQIDWNGLLEKAKQYKTVLESMKKDPFEDVNVKQQAIKQPTVKTESIPVDGIKILNEQLSRAKKNAENLYAEFKRTGTIADRVNFQRQATEIQGMERSIRRFNSEAGKTSNTFNEMKNVVMLRAKWEAAGSMANSTFNAPGDLVHSYREIEQAMAGVEQVLPAIEGDQRATNEEAMKFVEIANQYARGMEEVTKAGQLWGRGYGKDEESSPDDSAEEKRMKETQAVATTNELVRQSAMLATVDNFNMAESVKGLEATLSAYDMRAHSAAEATAFAGRAVDVFTKVAHNGQISAQDLIAGIDQTGKAASQAGISLEFLSAMIETGVRNTGKSGSEIGAAVKALTVGLHSKKGVAELQKFGIAIDHIGTDGVRRLRDMQSVILDVAMALQTGDKNAEQMLLAISGGRYQYSKISAMLRDQKEMMRMWETAIDSNGFAKGQLEVQMNTLNNKLKSAKANAEAVAIALGNDGWANGIKSGVDVLNSFLVGLKECHVALNALPVMAVAAFGIAGIKSGVQWVGKLRTQYQMLNELQSRNLLIDRQGNEISKTGAFLQGAKSKLFEKSRVEQERLNNIIKVGTDLEKASVLAVKNNISTKEAMVLVRKTEKTAIDVGNISKIKSIALNSAELAGETALSMGLNVLIGVLVVSTLGWLGYTEQQGRALTATERASEQAQEHVGLIENEIQVREKQVQYMDYCYSAHKKLDEAVKASTGNEEEHKKALSERQIMEQQLTRVLGDDAVQQIKDAGWTQAAYDKEKKAYIDGTDAKKKELKDYMQVELSSLTAQAAIIQKKIEQYRADAKAFGTAQLEKSKALSTFQNIWRGFRDWEYRQAQSTISSIDSRRKQLGAEIANSSDGPIQKIKVSQYKELADQEDRMKSELPDLKDKGNEDIEASISALEKQLGDIDSIILKYTEAIGGNSGKNQYGTDNIDNGEYTPPASAHHESHKKKDIDYTDPNSLDTIVHDAIINSDIKERTNGLVSEAFIRGMLQVESSFGATDAQNPAQITSGTAQYLGLNNYLNSPRDNVSAMMEVLYNKYQDLPGNPTLADLAGAYNGGADPDYTSKVMNESAYQTETFDFNNEKNMPNSPNINALAIASANEEAEKGIAEACTIGVRNVWTRVRSDLMDWAGDNNMTDDWETLARQKGILHENDGTYSAKPGDIVNVDGEESHGHVIMIDEHGTGYYQSNGGEHKEWRHYDKDYRTQFSGINSYISLNEAARTPYTGMRNSKQVKRESLRQWQYDPEKNAAELIDQNSDSSSKSYGHMSNEIKRRRDKYGDSLVYDQMEIDNETSRRDQIKTFYNSYSGAYANKYNDLNNSIYQNSDIQAVLQRNKLQWHDLSDEEKKKMLSLYTADKKNPQEASRLTGLFEWLQKNKDTVASAKSNYEDQDEKVRSLTELPEDWKKRSEKNVLHINNAADLSKLQQKPGMNKDKQENSTDLLRYASLGNQYYDDMKKAQKEYEAAEIDGNAELIDKYKTFLEEKQKIYYENEQKIREMQKKTNEEFLKTTNDVLDKIMVQGETFKNVWSSMLKSFASESLKRVMGVETSKSPLTQMIERAGGFGQKKKVDNSQYTFNTPNLLDQSKNDSFTLALQANTLQNQINTTQQATTAATGASNTSILQNNMQTLTNSNATLANSMNGAASAGNGKPVPTSTAKSGGGWANYLNYIPTIASFFKDGGSLEGFADGGAPDTDGLIKGAGTTRSDSILTYLSSKGKFIKSSDGEFIMNGKATSVLGTSFLNMLNQNPEAMAGMKRFADGGSLGESVEPIVSPKASSAQKTLTKNQAASESRSHRVLSEISGKLDNVGKTVNEVSNFNINAVDSRSFADLLSRNSGLLVGLLRKEQGRRNNV